MEGQYLYLNNQNFVKNAQLFTSCEHELSKNEIWIGNTSGNIRWESGVDIPHKFSHLNTIRLGEQAYCIRGKPISRDYCRPLIVSGMEYHKVEAIHKKEIEKIQWKYKR